MPKVSQIMLDNAYSDIKVVVNDNTVLADDPITDSGDIGMIFVVCSPKGQDRKVISITDGLKEYLEEFGEGPFNIYGQPALNARRAVSTGEIVGHILRVSAPDAGYGYAVIVAKYKIDDSGNMIVKIQKADVDTVLMEASELEDVYTSPEEPDAEGFSEVKLFSVISKGRGVYGNSLSFRITNNTAMDKENDYKNYVLEVYENESTGLNYKGGYSVVFNEDALVNDESLFTDTVVNDPDTGSRKLDILTHIDGFNTIIDAYNAQNPDSEFTAEDFDVILGIDKYTKKSIENYVVDTTSDNTIALNSVGGIFLDNGTDGSLEFKADDKAAQEARETLLNKLYHEAFSGKTDPMIVSKNKFPTTVIFDANYDIPTKQQIAILAYKRFDCVAILDVGTKCTTKQSVISYVRANFDGFVDKWVHCVDAYAGKIRDPFSKKVVTVTSTYDLIKMYIDLWIDNDHAKHRALAGNTRGPLTGYLKNSIYPVYDEDIDSELMNELTDMKVNFARLNARQVVIRASETTRQEVTSRLSDASNVFVVMDIIRDCRVLCTNYDYDFAEEEDIARFNQDLEIFVLDKYKDTQVREISGVFGQNDYEAQRDILHLNIGVEHKKKVKHFIIEVDVNRSSSAEG